MSFFEVLPFPDRNLMRCLERLGQCRELRTRRVSGKIACRGEALARRNEACRLLCWSGEDQEQPSVPRQASGDDHGELRHLAATRTKRDAGSCRNV